MADRPATPEEIEKWELSQIKQQKSRLHAKPIGSVMRKLLAERDYGAVASSQNLLDAWQAATGNRYAHAARPVKIQRGVLQVHVSNSLIMQELHFDRLRILKDLQSRLQEFEITDIRFRIGPVH